ncbi:MAG: hypothetical protein LBG60_01910 [Bifidobacteriaceae bacterium]|jgi:hypothetical protein|nr:hypothetical protein [Bifidobacteriaceae bacterium]
MRAKHAAKHRGAANPAYAAAMQELRRSNAAGPHPLKRRKGARSARLAEALRDQDARERTTSV